MLRALGLMLDNGVPTNWLEVPLLSFSMEMRRCPFESLSVKNLTVRKREESRGELQCGQALAFKNGRLIQHACPL